MSAEKEAPKETKVAANAEKVRPVFTLSADISAENRQACIKSITCNNCGKPHHPYMDNQQLVLATCVCSEDEYLAAFYAASSDE